jgi:tRNA (mo5U34)-methyltransferase
VQRVKRAMGWKGLSWGIWRATPKRTAVLKMVREGNHARDRRDWATAAAKYAQALAQDCDTNSPGEAMMTRARRAAICIQLGHVLREQGILDGAEAAYRESVALDGNSAEPRLLLGLVLHMQLRFAEAADSFFTALKTDPSCAAREQLRLLDYSDGEIDDALARDSMPFAPLIPPDPPFALQPVDDIRERVKSYYWHHSINLGGIVTPGLKSRYLLSREADVVFSPLDLRDRSVMDVGAWNGYFTVEARRRGAARLLALDHFTWTHSGLRGKETFDLVMSRLGIDAESLVIDVQEITVEAVGRWDVVLFLGVFYHLLDPIEALRRLAEITNEVLVLETHLDLQDLGRPAMVFYPGRELGGDETNWWGPNRACVEGLLKAVGFSKICFTQHPSSGPSRGFFHAFKSIGRC